MSSQDPNFLALLSMFEQLPTEVVREVYFKRCMKNYESAVECLLDMNDPDPYKVREKVLYYNQLDRNFDFQEVVKWKTFDNTRENHRRLLEGLDDPLTLDNFLEEIEEDPSIEVVQLPCRTQNLKCNFFKVNIVEALKSKPECPLCHTYYPIPGKQPTGSMSIKINRGFDCSGYRGKGTVTIRFSFRSGIQGPNHPNPGVHYSGTTRIAYIPLVAEGKRAIKLLEKGFQRGELFTVGRSLTTGADNQVVWGSVHMKTRPQGGIPAHGWPDPNYFERLKAECAAKMIFLDEEEEQYMGVAASGSKPNSLI
mmetsp:Transcript_16030/g.18744  ORF Transcript_16030/g.18744 Transcript_16030/m.18744 type:complete len:309 (+) Transcript_16030:89-1015(+)